MPRLLLALFGAAVIAAACGSSATTAPGTASVVTTAAPVTAAAASQPATASASVASPATSVEPPAATTSGTIPPAATPEASTVPATDVPSATATTGNLLVELAGAKDWLHAPGTVRLDLHMTGTFDAGTKEFPWLVDLTGSEITADFDLTKGDGKIQVSIPKMDNFTQDILVIEQIEYARSSLGGNIWVRQQANGAVGSLGHALRDPAGTALADAVSSGVLTASLGDDTTSDGTAVHTVVLAITVADTYDIEAFISATLGSKVGSTPPPAGPPAATKSVEIQLYLAADDLRPLGISLSMAAGASDPKVAGTGSVTIDGTFSRLPGTLSVKAPAKWVNGTSPYNPPR